jgi:hypothetical protein
LLDKLLVPALVRLAGGLACALAASAITAASAPAAEPLPFATMTPEDGAVVTQTATSNVGWMISGGPASAYIIYVRVSSTPDVGTDGQTLSDLHTLDYIGLVGSATDVGVYRGASTPGPTRWTNYPGTYYWQASANWTEYIPDDPSTPVYDPKTIYHQALSPIRRITVAAPQPSPAPPAPPATAPNPLQMSAVMAQYYVRWTIRTHTHRQPAGLTYGCARSGVTAFVCHPAWRDRVFTYRGTAQMKNTRRVGTTLYARVIFDGKRARRSCTRRKTFTRCATAVHWRDG